MSANTAKRPAGPHNRPDVKRPRSFLNCDYCREIKKKCEPAERDWEAGERCHNCVKRDLPCGPGITKFHESQGGGSSGVSGTGTGSLSASLAGAILAPSMPMLKPTNTSPPVPPLPFIFSTPSATQICLSHQTARLPPGFAATGPVLLPRPVISTSRVNAELHPVACPVAQHPGIEAAHNAPSPGQHLNVGTPTSVLLLQKIQESLDNGLRELDKTFTLVYNVTCRSQAAGTALPLLPTPASKEYELTLGVWPVDKTCEQFVSTLQQQVALLELHRIHAPDQQEVWLRRLLEFARPLCQKFQTKVEKSRQEPDGMPKKLIDIYGTILLTLIRVCDEAGNSGAADRFLVELGSLPTFVKSLENAAALMARLQRAFQQQSALLDHSWRELGLNELQNPFHNSPRNLFCYEHLIMLSEMPTATIHSVLKYEADKGRHDRLKRQDMHIAVETANPDLVRLVYEQDKQSLKDTDIFQMTPILLAALVGNFRVFTMLYNFGADLNALDRFLRDVLVISSEMGHDDIVNFLLNKGMSPNEGYSGAQYSPLFAASGRGRLSTVSILLSKGANPKQVWSRKTPKEVAESNGHHEISRLLEEAEAKSRTSEDNQSLSDGPFDAGVPTWARTQVVAPRGSPLTSIVQSPNPTHATTVRQRAYSTPRQRSSPGIVRSPMVSVSQVARYPEPREAPNQKATPHIIMHNHGTDPLAMPTMSPVDIAAGFEAGDKQSEAPGLRSPEIPASCESFEGEESFDEMFLQSWTDLDVPDDTMDIPSSTA